MELHASDIVALYRPSLCENRILRRERGEPKSEPSAFDEVLRRLGIRHEREHLARLGPHLDLSPVPFPERFQRTAEAIFNREPVLYQPAFEVAVTLDGLQTAIVGVPDFLIWSNDGYLIRDSKLGTSTRRIIPRFCCRCRHTVGCTSNPLTPLSKAFRFTAAPTTLLKFLTMGDSRTYGAEKDTGHQTAIWPTV